MTHDVLKPTPQLLTALGSIIVHYEEWTSNSGHQLDKITIDAMMKREDVREWFKGMNEMALLPLKRDSKK